MRTNNLAIVLRLQSTYRKNALLFSLQRNLFFRHLISDDVYGSRNLRGLFYGISALKELFGLLFGKLVYLLCLYGLGNFLAKSCGLSAAQGFMQLALFLGLAGALLNNPFYQARVEAYYAVSLLGIPAGSYLLSSYAYFLAKTLLGLALAAVVVGEMAGVPMPARLMLPVLTVGAKLCAARLQLWVHRPGRSHKNASRLKNTITLGGGLALTALGFGLPYLGFCITEQIFVPLSVGFAVAGLLAALSLYRYKSYAVLYRDWMKSACLGMGDMQQVAADARKKQMKDGLCEQAEVGAGLSGYARFHALFFARHKKLLQKPTRITALVCLIVFSIVTVGILVLRARGSIGQDALGTLEGLLLWLPLLFFSINRGDTMTQAMFFNCDRSMLSYGFYRTRRTVLLLFFARLRTLALHNLLPALVFSVFLPLLLFLIAPSAPFVYYLVCVFVPLLLSVFFSVHSMVLYYLLQPYTAELQKKSLPYSLVRGLTYWVCFLLKDLPLPLMLFGLITAVFCLLYLVLATVLVFALSHKTFRLRA